MTNEQVVAALEAAKVSAGPLEFTFFDHVKHVTNGKAYACSFAEWAQNRAAYAKLAWPSAEELIDRMDRIEAELTGEEAEDELAAAIKEAKVYLPVEVGATLTDGRRTDASVETLTWLFVDVDGVDDVEQVRSLHKLLTDGGLNHIVTESATSRLHGKGMRIHLIVQLVPVVLPSTSLTPRKEVKEWWRKIFAAAASALTGAAGLKYDDSVDDMAQSAFVPHIPPGSATRKLSRCCDGMALDLEAFVAALGVEVARPGSAVAQREGVRPVKPVVEATKPQSKGPAEEDAAPNGPTPGHTTGSLIMVAVRHFGYLGRCVDKAAGKWLMRCPWAERHKSDPRQVLGYLDDSTVLFDNVTTHGEDGGFECKHNGCRDNGLKKSAADVLRWARLKGCPLPDREAWGGSQPAQAPEEGEAPMPKHKDPRPRIVVKVNDVAGMRDAAIAALSSRGDIFVKDESLVDLKPAGPRPIPSEHLVAILGEVARWVSLTRSADGELSEKPAKVPREVVGAILKAPQWPGIAELRVVARHPALLPDGRLIVTPGYDAESKILYLPDVEFPVPERPDYSAALAARDRLINYIRHTNFVDAAGASIWLGFLLSLAARTAFPTLPIFGFDAAVASSGKTSLVKIAYGLVYGELPQLGAPVVDDDAEAEKRLPTWARMPLVVWDNVKHTFGSPIVDGAITAGRATTRLLSTNESMTFDFTSTAWAMTGNNLAVGDDAASRCVIARIQAPTSRRYDFAVDDATFYQAHRPRAVVDALTILRAFQVAGSPQKEGIPYCRFVEWSRLIRQALLWLGMPDPIGEVVDSSMEGKAEALRALYRVFKDGPFHAGDIDTAFRKGDDEDEDAFRLRRAVVDALSAVAGRKVEGAAKVGHALKKLRDVSFPTKGGGRVRFEVQAEGNRNSYRLVFEDIQDS